MKREWMLWAILGLSVCGCRMCQAPYDYSGPVFDQGYQYGFLERRGSAFTGYSPVQPEVPVESNDDPQPTIEPIPDRLNSPMPSTTPPGE
jgi:hypothetical protein